MWVGLQPDSSRAGWAPMSGSSPIHSNYLAWEVDMAAKLLLVLALLNLAFLFGELALNVLGVMF